MNEEGIRKRIRVLLEEIQNEADPVLLNRCRSIFRQEVSFFRRSYMAAYLLLLAEEGKAAIVSTGSHLGGQRAGRPEQREGRRAGRSEQRDAQRAGRGAGQSLGQSPEQRDKGKNRSREQEAPRSLLSDEESVRLFISIGRNRKVFPREILALINAKAKIDREDIGAIRVLDNYSFVQIRTSAADAVIQTLNGQSFRGRTLTVNYARTRREGEEDDAQQDLPSETDNDGQ